MKFDISVFFQNVMTFEVSLKSDKNNGYITWWPMYISDNIWPISSLGEIVSLKSCRDNQNTRFMFNKSLCENCAFYKIEH